MSCRQIRIRRRYRLPCRGPGPRLDGILATTIWRPRGGDSGRDAARRRVSPTTRSSGSHSFRCCPRGSARALDDCRAAQRGRSSRPPPTQVMWHIALWEVGGRCRLDGSTALMAAGLTGYDDEIHLSLPHGSTVGQMAGVRRHEIRRWAEGDTAVRGGLRTTQTALAAIHAATWAHTRRQAALLLVMAVQQRVTTARPFSRRSPASKDCGGGP